MRKIYVLEIQQPIGTFYAGKMTAQDIISISSVSRRMGNTGHQRMLKEKRAKDIALYCNDPDATFPTPIILSVNDEDFISIDCPVPEVVCFEFDETKKCAEILDGQHRMAGIQNAGDFNYELPVIIMFSLREEQKGYVFSTINGNQAKVDRSLIYDLFDLTETPSPFKTCHQIARIMNADKESPFYRRLKMLEKREDRFETISQSTFVTNLCGYLISKNSQEDEIKLKRGISLVDNNKLPLRKYFIQRKDEVILRILMNYFSAAKNVFSYEWENPDKYILTKSVGFEGLISALTILIPEGEQQGDLSENHFEIVFLTLKELLKKKSIDLTSQSFPSSSQNATQLSKLIIEANNLAYHDSGK